MLQTRNDIACVKGNMWSNLNVAGKTKHNIHWALIRKIQNTVIIRVKANSRSEAVTKTLIFVNSTDF